MTNSPDFQSNIPEEYLNSDFDFGFTNVDESELNEILELDAAQTTPDEIADIQNKLSQILQMNSTCEGANQVKEQYDELLTAKLSEVEKIIIPLLVNLKKNTNKDYIYWPGATRDAQCNLQIQKVLSVTRNGSL
tara:strand:- start:480 stop:881 length:402 start_codon:yes stop_codon:yes gene_type:complete